MFLLVDPKYTSSEADYSGIYDQPEAFYTISDLPPTLKTLCSCESRGDPSVEPWQFLPDGTVIIGLIHPPDTGACQINTKAHGNRLEELGIDVFTEHGNVEFAMILYNEAGTTPWGASEACWAAHI